ncbi:MAG: AAA family ATPase [Anaerotignaceae bacterium]
MLTELHIKDVALIDKAELEFFKGLNILSGETGAGKSMIIDAINFVLGQRATKDFVRNGEAKAQVEAVFLVEEKSVLKSLSEIGIECDDGTIVVQRILTKDGRNSIRINGSMVTVAMLKQISTGLIDVHGQHEHQSLLNSSKHIDILDKFCQKNLDPIKIEMVSHIAQYKKILKQLEALSGDEFEREEKIQNLQFKIKEIEDAQLKENEDTYLLDRKNYLLSIDKIIKATNESLFCLYFNETEHTATDLIDTACGHIEDLSALDAPCQKLYNDIIVIKEELDDLIKNLRKYKDNINQDPEELDSVDERLDMIYRLKKKYGPTLEDILSFKKQADEELRFIENSEEELEKLKKEKNKVYEKIKMGCEKMTMIRISKAKELQ